MTRERLRLVIPAMLLLLAGCEVNPQRRGEFQAISMWNQSRLKPLEESPMLAGRSSSDTPVPGTVARGEPPADATLVTGLSGGKLAARFPFPVTEAVVKHGQERFNVLCAPCHGRLGDGQGMIVNPKPTADNQDWDGDDADRADRLRFEEEQAMIREQSEARAAKAAAEAKKTAAAEKDAADKRAAEK